MGAAHSTAAVLASQQQLLQRLAGPEPIPHAAPFWDQLFSLPMPLASLDPADVELALAPHCRQLRECRPPNAEGVPSRERAPLRPGALPSQLWPPRLETHAPLQPAHAPLTLAAEPRARPASLARGRRCTARRPPRSAVRVRPPRAPSPPHPPAPPQSSTTR
jgi:hypothetical protein